MAAASMVGKRVSVYWPEEDAWFEGVVTEKGQSPSEAPGVYNNVGWRVEYDDGDMGWVADLSDESKVKMVDAGGADAPPLMTGVATSANIHARHGERIEAGGAGEAERTTAVKFANLPSAEFSRQASGE